MHNILNQLNNNSSKTLMVTFGCSWTYGVGIHYTDGMTELEFVSDAWDDDLSDSMSFRGLLSNEFDVVNLNFAEGGSSNQRQFREFFTNPYVIENIITKYKLIVIWAVTSIYRNELWSNSSEKYENFRYTDINLSNFEKNLFKESHDTDAEVKKLSEEIIIWNGFFESIGIKNLWVDTFNTHNYITNFDNIVIPDLMTQMTNNAESSMYHYSNWENDDSRIDDLITKKLLNPISFHPTKMGHEKIAEILKPHIKSLMCFV